MHRRDFLQPQRLAQWAGQAQRLLDDLAEQPEPAPVADLRLVRFGRRAMATQFEVILPFGTPGASALAELALGRINQLEDQLTVYRDTSEVSRLNATALDGPVPVAAGLFALLRQCADLTARTEGAFDVAAGALIKAWGFYRGPRRVPSEEELAEALARTGMRWVGLGGTSPPPAPPLLGGEGGRSDRERGGDSPDDPSLLLPPSPPRRGGAGGGEVAFLRPVELNLGSIGKGYALDRAAADLCAVGVTSALLHGGHSSILAVGTQPGEPRGWPVAVGHPWVAGRRLAILHLRDRAMATSAATHQHFEHEGRKLGHILDPRTGWPAAAVESATVIAPTAAEADALATAFFILGVGWARAYCKENPAVGAVLLPQGRHAVPVVLNLPPDVCAIEGL